jgi:hypothetical protein
LNAPAAISIVTAALLLKSDGLMVTVFPAIVTVADVTLMVCVVIPPSLIRIFPVPFCTGSLNVSARLLLTAILVELSAGE